jgi:hypothetical protein
MKLKKSELKEFLDEKVELYNRPSLIELDPISIPHRYSKKEDIEISGFLAATIAWGNPLVERIYKIHTIRLLLSLHLQ